MGKPRLSTTTREAHRLRLLCGLLADPGHPELGRLNRARIAELTGVDISHLHKICIQDRPRGLGADIVRKMRDGLRIDPWFFFDDAEPTSLNIYVLSKERVKRSLADHESRLVALEEALALTAAPHRQRSRA